MLDAYIGSDEAHLYSTLEEKHIDPQRFRQWRKQFPPEYQGLALKIVDNIQYIPTEGLKLRMNHVLDRALEQIDEGPIALISPTNPSYFCRPGKVPSGYVIAEWFQQDIEANGAEPVKPESGSWTSEKDREAVEGLQYTKFLKDEKRAYVIAPDPEELSIARHGAALYHACQPQGFKGVVFFEDWSLSGNQFSDYFMRTLEDIKYYMNPDAKIIFAFGYLTQKALTKIESTARGEALESIQQRLLTYTADNISVLRDEHTLIPTVGQVFNKQEISQLALIGGTEFHSDRILPRKVLIHTGLSVPDTIIPHVWRGVGENGYPLLIHPRDQRNAPKTRQ